MRYFLPEINEIAARFNSHVRIGFIYIEEAHATNEWQISSINNQISQHTTLEERYAALELLRQKYTFHPAIQFYLDTMENDFNRVFPSWPMRYWLIDNEKKRIVLKGMPVGDRIVLDELVSWLEKNYSSVS